MCEQATPEEREVRSGRKRPAAGLPKAPEDTGIEGAAMTVDRTPPSWLRKSEALYQSGKPEDERDDKALMESERRFRMLLEAVRMIAIILAEQGDISFCNDYLLQLTGWRREEILMRNLCDLFVPPEQYSPEVYRARFAAGLIPSDHENEIFTKHGVRRLISWSNIILFDETGKRVGTAGIGQDVTDSRRVEEALRSREEKFRQIAEKRSRSDLDDKRRSRRDRLCESGV
jgi:PAS domain S-box-containing protein